MNILKAKLIEVDEGHILVIEAEAETQDAVNARLTIQVDWHGFAEFLRIKYKMSAPGSYDAATNTYGWANYENDLIEWLNETLTFIPVAIEKKVKELEAKIARLEEMRLAF